MRKTWRVSDGMQQDAGQETIHKHSLQGSGFRPEEPGWLGDLAVEFWAERASGPKTRGWSSSWNYRSLSL